MAEIRKVPNVMFEDARIIFRNFEGKPTTFKPAGGVRDFALVLDDAKAEAMIADGWNVKYLKAREDVEDSEPQPYIIVTVTYGAFPPRIVLITSRGKTVLTADSVNVLDAAEIEKLDLIIRPYNWEVHGNAGVKAYVKSMYVTLAEDELERKYSDIRDVPDSDWDSDFESPDA